MDTVAKAGWAEIDITPPLGLPMGGRGPRYAPGTEILDPLKAQVLMLEDGTGKQILLASFDLIGLSFQRSSALRYEISALTGIPYDAIILNYAHTHSGPMVNFDKYPGFFNEPPALIAYHDNLRQKILNVVEKATQSLQQVVVSLHFGNSDIGINRRRKIDNGTVVLAPNPDGTYNSDLWVLSIQAMEDDSRCIVFSIGCHPVIVYGYAWQGISADFPGACRRALKERFGHRTQCQFIQGLAGNIRPRILADFSSVKFRKSNRDDHICVGKVLAQNVESALSQVGETLLLKLKTASGWVPVFRDQTKVLSLPEWQTMAQSEDELSRNVGRYWTDRIVNGIPLARASPMELGILHLSEKHAVAWISAEAVAEWMPLIRSIHPSTHIFVWGYCQFVPTYLPTDSLLPEGGYEVVNANMYEINGPGPFSKGLDESFVNVFRELLAM